MIDKRLTPRILAYKSGIPIDIIEKWLSGENDLFVKIKNLCDTLDCSSDYLFGLTRYNRRKSCNNIYAELSYYESKIRYLKSEIKEQEQKWGYIDRFDIEYPINEDNSYIEKLNKCIERNFFV